MDDAKQPLAGEQVTIHDIAEAAGVHPSTVSRALAATPSRPVAEATVARVRTIAAELGYRANPWAKSLRTRRTRTIGLVIPHLEDNVLALVFEAAAQAALEHGYQTITVSTGDDPERSATAIEALLDRRVDGLLLATALLADPAIDTLRATELPYVLLNRAHDDDLCVRADDELGAYLATRHLIERGHRRIALLAGIEGASTGQFRRAGFDRAFVEAGLQPDPGLVFWSELGIGSGARLGRRLLDAVMPPTAIFATNDFLALGVMSAARDLSIGIPDELALVGFNNTEVGAALPVPLSSVAVPLHEMGRTATQALLDLIESRPATGRIYTPELIVRRSSDSWRPAPASRQHRP